MANKPDKKSKLKGNKPRLTGKKGKMLSAQEQADNIDAWVNSSFEEELRLTAFLDVNTRRQVRLATGIGDMGAFIKEFNNGLSGAISIPTPENEKIKKELREDLKRKPKLRKVSQEYVIGYRPPSK